MLSGGFWVLLMVATPLLAVIYRAPEIIGPGLVTLLAMPGGVLQTPVWKFARDMDWKRQRLLTSVDPVVGVVVTIAVAAAGGGYWAFALGNVVGSWAGAAVIVPNSPYKLRFRYDRGTARQYLRFSTPIFVSNLSRIALLQGTVLTARAAVGVAGVGALSLASSIRNYTELADSIVSTTMYPAVCAVKDRVDLMHESFVKSNRLALMWGFPTGIAIALFAGDLVQFVLGAQWEPVVGLLEATAVVSGIGHIAFNWDDYIRATGDTKPIGKAAWIGVAGWFAGPIPLMWIYGLDGYAGGLFVVSAVNFATRGYYMRRLFPGFAMLRHGVRAILPTVPAAAIVLLVRSAESAPRTVAVAAAEAVIFVIVTGVVTWLAERELLRESIGYLRRARAGSPRLAT
jgi:PST family polysaccharide transporter